MKTSDLETNEFSFFHKYDFLEDLWRRVGEIRYDFFVTLQWLSCSFLSFLFDRIAKKSFSFILFQFSKLFSKIFYKFFKNSFSSSVISSLPTSPPSSLKNAFISSSSAKISSSLFLSPGDLFPL